MQDNHTTKRIARRFTIAEANAMLPLVSSIASDIQGVFRSVTSRRSDLHRLLRRGNRSSGAHYDDEMAESRADLQEEYDKIWYYREELESLGLHLRSPEDGSIEFPASVQGREAFYCWQLGDQQISFWRDVKSDPSSRQPLPSLGIDKVRSDC